MTIMTLREFLILFKLTERNVTITNAVRSYLSSVASIQRKTISRSQGTRARASEVSRQAFKAPDRAMCCIVRERGLVVNIGGNSEIN